MRIEGAVALVTGSNRGLGEAFVTTLEERGARVYATTRADLDITNPVHVEAAAKRCGDVTLLINNAVSATTSPLLSAPTMDVARQEMETNYFGTLAMCKAFAPVLTANGGGALVNMLSIVSFFSYPGMGSLCATKSAAWSLTNSVRLELPDTLVVGVHASFIDTRLADGFDGPKHRPEHIAGLVLDAVEAGQEEVLADERTRAVKLSALGS
ncbi:SDR family NAD(P)-dependent oxidoreductase [Actinocrispum sp. NPDC049592]|uniref:SDR family NAD(P)-dependent oxidoreductase n=1 Tax=Actinocrispum sp. NPDC049592 TaxID=3154835 RepID=UPI00343D30ED